VRTRINLRPLPSIVRLGDELEVDWGLVHVDHFVVELVALSLYEFMEAGDLVLLGRRCAIDVLERRVRSCRLMNLLAHRRLKLKVGCEVATSSWALAYRSSTETLLYKSRSCKT